MGTTTIDVIILSYAKNEHLKALTVQTITTLQSSEQNTGIAFNIIVIESEKALNNYQYQSTQTIYPTEKFNFNQYLNIGIKASNSKYVCLCNNDLIFHKGWATEILLAFKQPEIECASTYWEKYHLHERNIGPNTGYVAGYRSLFSGWCFVVKRSLFEKIGLFDEKINFWFSDDDFCNTLQSAGINNLLITTSHVTHVGGYSVNHISEKDKKTLTILPMLYFSYKWQHKSFVKYYAETLWHKFKINFLSK